MPRLNLLFSETYFARLQENAAKKGVSLAHYARDLIDVGLHVEEITAQQMDANDAPKKAVSRLGDKELWKNSLACVLESRYLLRYLVDNLAHVPREKRELVLTTVKEKAQAVAAELLEA